MSTAPPEIDVEVSGLVAIKAPFPVANSVVVPLPTAEVELIATAPETCFRVTLRLRLPLEESGNPKGAMSLEAAERAGILVLSGMPPTSLHAGFLLWQRIQTVVLKTSALTRDMRLQQSFRDTQPGDAVHDVCVAAFGSRIQCAANPRGFPRLRDGVISPKLRTLEQEETLSVLRDPASRADVWLARADRAQDRNENSYFVADLATAMETTAYEVYRQRTNRDPPTFSTAAYFGDVATGTASNLGLTPTLAETDFAAFVGACELWGTRHEALHNGILQVRTFDPNTGKTSRTSLRPLTYEDTVRFRSSVVAAIEWMRTT